MQKASINSSSHSLTASGIPPGCKVKLLLQIALVLLALLSFTQGVTAGAAEEGQHTPSASSAWWNFAHGRRLRASGGSSREAHDKSTQQPQLRKLLQSNSPVPAASNGSASSNNDTLSPNGTSADGGTKLSLNPWYDQHLLSTTGGGWGSGLLYGRINSSSKGSLDAAAAAADGSETDQDKPQAAQDPPPYEYPSVGRHPTVFFTAVLHSFGSTNGLRPDEQLAFSSAINSFLAPSANSVITNTTIITQALAGSGLWLPCATAFFALDSAPLQDYLASTLQSDPNLILPTATWGSVRTANIKVAQPAAPTSISYTWVVGEYNNCSVMCGGGTQQREVSCLDNYGNAAEPNMCSPPVPANSRTCQTQSCQASLPSSFSLMLGPWSACNSTCSYGSRTRTATCVSKEGYIGSISSCNTTPEELSNQLWQPCVLPPCPTFIWSYSDWACDNTAGCGGGTASRNATCIIASSGQAVNSSVCGESPLVTSTQPCAQGPCILFYWRARELADCLPEDASKPCGRYLQRRGFDCVNMTSGEVLTNNFCTGPKPVLGEVECSKPSNVDCSGGGGGAGGLVTVAGTADPGGVTTSSSAAQTDASAGFAGAANVSSSAGMPAGDSSSSSSHSSPQPSAGVASQQGGPGGPSAPTNTLAASSSSVPAPATADGSDTKIKDTSPSPVGSAGGSIFHSSSTEPWPAGNTANGGNDSSVGTLPGDIGTNDNTTSTPGAASSGTAGGSSSLSAVDTVSVGSSGDPAAFAIGGSSTSSTGGGGGGGLPGPDLGPGAALPAWLMSDPTPELKTLLACQGGYALSADGQCCSGPLIDAKGSCCEAGVVDACGICNGTGRAIDSLGMCCSGVLDAQGICCTGLVDECGVCNGTNTCDLKAELVAAVSPAVLFLVPASNANRRLRTVLQEDIAAGIGTATGRPVEKARIAVLLSAYSGPGSSSTSSRGSTGSSKAPTEGWVTASEGLDNGIVGAAARPSTAPHADGSAKVPSDSNGLTAVAAPQAVAALPAGGGGGGGSAGSKPVQMDAVVQAPEQLDAQATHANLAAQWQPSTGAVELKDSAALSVGRADDGQQQQQQQLKQGNAQPVEQQQSGANDADYVTPADKPNQQVGASEGVLRHLQHAWEPFPEQWRHHAGRALTQLDTPSNHSSSSTSSSDLDPSNAIRVTVILKAPMTGSGSDTGSVLLALNTLMGRQLQIPGTRSSLTYKQVASVVRAGTCGNGICQVNERLSWNNPDSCQVDCALPFLSCPPFDTGQPPCNGLGVCYNSIGSCACTKGYAGADCSSCAAGYKRVNGFCVAGAALVPPRSCGAEPCVGNLTDGSSLAVVPPARSLASGQAAVMSVVLGSMLVALCAAVLLYRAWWRRLLQMQADDVAVRAQQAAD